MKAAHLLSDIYAPTAKAKQLYLDPRTKIVLCLAVSFIIFDDFAGGERVADRVGGAAAHLSADAAQI